MDKLKYYDGLKLQHVNSKEDYQLICSGNPIDEIGNNCYVIGLENFKTPHKQKLSNFRTYMRPLSSLTKPITVEGYNASEPFVPLQEMAKIVMDGIIVINQYTEWLDVSSCNRMEIVTNVLGQDYYLAYDLVKESFVFGIATNRKYQTFSPKGQLSLFTLMFSWGIWLFDQSEFGKSLIEIKG